MISEGQQSKWCIIWFPVCSRCGCSSDKIPLMLCKSLCWWWAYWVRRHKHLIQFIGSRTYHSMRDREIRLVWYPSSSSHPCYHWKWTKKQYYWNINGLVLQCWFNLMCNRWGVSIIPCWRHWFGLPSMAFWNRTEIPLLCPSLYPNPTSSFPCSAEIYRNTLVVRKAKSKNRKAMKAPEDVAFLERGKGLRRSLWLCYLPFRRQCWA